MLSQRLSTVLALLTATSALVACTATSNGSDSDTKKSKSKTSPAKSHHAGDDDDDDTTEEDTSPHAEGTIVLGESHEAGASNGRPIVLATFSPVAAAADGGACAKTIDGCAVTFAPKCTKTTYGCDTGETCVLDDDCKSVCKPMVRCEKACDDEEVCTLVAGATDGKGTCTKLPVFDAGPIAFSGTTTPITLFPPYAYESSGTGAPFLAGSELHVQAQGAAANGFEAFEEKLTATTFMQTSPALQKLDRSVIFGTDALPIGWVPGKDSVVVSLAGRTASARCTVDDAKGAFEVSREVLAAVSSPSTDGSAPYLSISVARERTETKKDKKAKGSIDGVDVPSKGWLTLTTTSVESASFQGCSAGQATCATRCAVLASDPENCGACGNACTSGQYCSAGKCK